jgi:murein DD-endopeptidase
MPIHPRFYILSAFLFLSSVVSLSAQANSDTALRQLPLSKMVFPIALTSIEPTVVRIGGHNALCYELYIVNSGSSPIELSRVQVLSLDSHEVLLDQAGDALAAALRHSSKTQPAAGTTGLIAPGEQVIYYAWVDLKAGAPVPSAIDHALTMKPQGGSDEVKIVTRTITVKSATETIESPLRGKNWLAGNGPGNTSGHRRGVIPLDGVAEVPQRFAIDWVQVDKSGKTYSGDEKKNENYFCYGQKIHAVAEGVVTEVKDGIPQNVPGVDSRAVPITLETVAGNHIILDLGHGVYAFYAHLQPGSLRVKLGDHVKSGDVIALLGNSGNSTEPHLHFHLIDHNSPLGGEGLPFSYPHYQLLGKGSLDGEHLDWLAAAKEIKAEIPADNEIVQFSGEDK